MLWTMCKRDLLFYINTFGYLHEPRTTGGGVRVLPFITYPFQDDALLEMADHSGEILIRKTRCMGATWMSVYLLEHKWHFYDYESSMVVSRTENEVDTGRSLKAMLPKMDFILKHQPGWLRPAVARKHLQVYNQDSSSVVDGTATTANIGRGGRLGNLLVDEFAAFEYSQGFATISAVVSLANLVIWNSTPQGVGNAYHAKWENPAVKKIEILWPAHPVYNKGMYTSKDGEVVKIDTDYIWPADYKFIRDGKLRSPWYDDEAAKIGIPSLVAQELDGEFLGSGANFFDADLLKALRDADKGEKCTVRPYYHIGELDYVGATAQPTEWMDRKNGRMRLWLHPDAKGDLPSDRLYTIGCDIAAGTGASNSCMSIFDTKTGEKVAEWMSPLMRPEEFAVLAVASSRWFKGSDGNGAFLIWEANGPGRQFGARVLEIGYRNIFYRQDEHSIAKRTSDVPGFWTTKDTKKTLLGEYGRALGSGAFINRSDRALEDCFQYIFDAGEIIHIKSKTTVDPSGARENHGDMVIADALAWRGYRQRKGREERPKAVVPPDSFMARRMRRQAARSADASLWVSWQ